MKDTSLGNNIDLRLIIMSRLILVWVHSQKSIGDSKSEDNFFYLHYCGDYHSGPYKVKLKGEGSVYAMYADNSFHSDYVTVQIVNFLNFDCENIEETKEAPLLRPFGDYKTIIETY